MDSSIVSFCRAHRTSAIMFGVGILLTGVGIFLSIAILVTSLPFENPVRPNACPRIVTRAEWGARPPKSFTTMPTPVPYVVIHHSYMTPCSNFDTCVASVREIQDLHMDTNGWDDIGYSFLIGGDGVAYQGRGWNRVGAHAPNFNDKSIGICLMGDFTVSLPVQAQLDGTQAMIECGLDFNHINSTYMLLGHRDTRITECPGEALYQEILTWPHKGLPPTTPVNKVL